MKKKIKILCLLVLGLGLVACRSLEDFTREGLGEDKYLGEIIRELVEEEFKEVKDLELEDLRLEDLKGELSIGLDFNVLHIDQLDLELESNFIADEIGKRLKERQAIVSISWIDPSREDENTIIYSYRYRTKGQKPADLIDVYVDEILD